MPLALDEDLGNRSSSRMATIVSCPPAEMIISFCIRETPGGSAGKGEQSARRHMSSFRKALLIADPAGPAEAGHYVTSS